MNLFLIIMKKKLNFFPLHTSSEIVDTVSLSDRTSTDVCNIILNCVYQL